MKYIKTFEEFVNEGYGHSFDNEDMSPAGQQRKREQEARDERAYNARQHASQYQAPRSVQSPKPAPQKASTSLSAIAGDKSGEVTFPFAALLGQVKKALEGLSSDQRTKAKKGTAIFKQGMDMYYNALNARTCKEKDKRQYNEDAKECADTEDLYQLIDMYIEEYENSTGKEGDGTVFVPRKQPDPEGEDEKAERMRHNWY